MFGFNAKVSQLEALQPPAGFQQGRLPANYDPGAFYLVRRLLGVATVSEKDESGFALASQEQKRTCTSTEATQIMNVGQMGN